MASVPFLSMSVLRVEERDARLETGGFETPLRGSSTRRRTQLPPSSRVTSIGS